MKVLKFGTLPDGREVYQITFSMEESRDFIKNSGK
jgi:hypothetical protein